MIHYKLFVTTILAIEIGLVALTIFIFWRVWRSGGIFRRVAQNLALLCFTPLLILTMVEIGFALFFIQPDGINFTLAAQGWHDRYWNPINSLGYRDREWKPEDLLNRNVIMVTGDSFAAGGGIERIEDRFSGRLGVLLGDDYAIMTVAKSGWGLPDELQAVQDYPHEAEILILSHFMNDIEQSSAGLDLSRPGDLLKRPQGTLGKMVDHSHLINFTYWRFYRWKAYANPLGRKEVQTYQAYLRTLFEHPEVWQTHTQMLTEFHNYSEAKQQQLIVVVFPDMLRVDTTRDLADKVATFYQTIGVPVVNVADLVVDMPAHRRIVNTIDTHASAEVHALVAMALKEVIVENPHR